MTFANAYSLYRSPIGTWLLLSDGEALTGVYPETHAAVPDMSGFRRDDHFFTGVIDQLGAYFAGRLTEFTVKLAPQGTGFQRRVWAALQEIPLGATTTYGCLAAHLGAPSASRAVGAANAKNPISIIIPCHRVVGTSGVLTGYAGGLEMKRWLLDHEGSARRALGGVTPLGLASMTRHATQLAL